MRKRVILNRVAELLAIKERREGRRITQKAAAEELGVPESTFARWYRNDITRRDDWLVLKLMDYFDCDLDELLIVEETIVEDTESPEIKKPTMEPMKIPA